MHYVRIIAAYWSRRHFHNDGLKKYKISKYLSALKGRFTKCKIPNLGIPNISSSQHVTSNSTIDSKNSLLLDFHSISKRNHAKMYDKRTDGKKRATQSNTNIYHSTCIQHTFLWKFHKTLKQNYSRTRNEVVKSVV